MPATNASHVSLSKMRTGLVSGVLPSRTPTVPPPRSEISMHDPCAPQRELRRQICPAGSVASDASLKSPVSRADPDPDPSGNFGSGRTDCRPIFACSRASRAPQAPHRRAVDRRHAGPLVPWKLTAATGKPLPKVTTLILWMTILECAAFGCCGRAVIRSLRFRRFSLT